MLYCRAFFLIITNGGETGKWGSRGKKRHRPNGRCLQQIISTLCTGEGRFAAAVLYGYSFETTNELANELLNRGGMDHTMWTINLILLAVAYGGALERCGCVEALFGKLKHHLHSVGSLILAIIMYNPKEIKHIVLDGHSLTLESFVAVARYGATVELADSALKAMEESRALAEKIADEGRVAYGITTGFGDFQRVAVSNEMSNQLSTNLILSHCTATGEPFAEDVVRGMLLLRANALCVGVSGVRPILVQMMIEMLNKGVHPVVPQKGSLGSSGDLAPLAHMSLPLLGKGMAVYQGEKMTGAEAMAKAGIKTLDTLVSKEGLGLTNGTCAMTSVGFLALYDTICAAQLGDVISSMAFEGLTGLRNAFDPRIHAVRGQKGQMLVAKNMKMLLEGSEILDNCQNDRVQDAYALRCIPQLHGAVRDALDYVLDKVEIELNAVTDNPLMFLEDEAVISGGNFHGEPMAIPFDTLGIACSEIADASERRTERMVNAALSNGLTPFLRCAPAWPAPNPDGTPPAATARECGNVHGFRCLKCQRHSAGGACPRNRPPARFPWNRALHTGPSFHSTNRTLHRRWRPVAGRRSSAAHGTGTCKGGKQW